MITEILGENKIVMQRELETTPFEVTMVCGDTLIIKVPLTHALKVTQNLPDRVELSCEQVLTPKRK